MEQRLELFAAAQVRLGLLERAGDGQRAVCEGERAGGGWDAFADDVGDARRFDGGLARWGLAGGPEVAERLLALVGAVRLVVGDVFVVGAQGGAVVGHRERGAAGVGELGEDVVGDAALAGLGGVVGEGGGWEGGGEREGESERAGGSGRRTGGESNTVRGWIPAKLRPVDLKQSARTSSATIRARRSRPRPGFHNWLSSEPSWLCSPFASLCFSL